MLEFLPKPMRQIAKGILKLCVAGFLLFYLLSPVDLLPEVVFGPLGYIDDVLVLMFGAGFLGFDFFGRAKETRAKYRAKQ